MKRFALFLMVAGMLSMVACKSAPKKEEATKTEPAVEQVDTTQTGEIASPDTTQHPN